MPQRLNSIEKISTTAAIASQALAALKREANVTIPPPLRQKQSVLHNPVIISRNPKQNRLLASFPDEDYERIFPALEMVSLEAGMTLCKAGEQLRYVYFPTSCIVSISLDTQDGASLETAVIGKEGVVGVNALLGGGPQPHNFFVKCEGTAFRLNVNIMKEAFNRGGILQSHLLRFTQALLAQISQTAVCSRHHTVVQQLCRWLLLSVDRLPTNEMIATQERIAYMLGVRRETIAEAAAKLQDEGLIRCTRGRFYVTNRAAMEERVCECYGCVSREYSRLLPYKAPAFECAAPGR